VAQVNRGKTAIEFSGTAAQLRAAFQTELHTYIVNGEVHHANDRDPQIPLALAPVVAGITPMNDFRPRSDTVTRGRATYNVLTHQATPEWTQTTSTLELAPDDFAVQYDVNPLYNAGVTGAGITIGVIGDSNIDPSLVAAYRSLFHLPANPINVILAGNDPGITGSYGEAYLDVEEAGAIAPGATVNFYTAQDTFVQQGTALAALREVDDDVASVLSASYGVCEQTLGAAGNQFWNAVWEQAAAQGQTTLVSTGDYGAAGCDDIQAEVGNQVEYGIAVNGIASTPWNIAVGGTDFYYSDYNGAFAALDAQIASYWNQTITTLPSTSLLAPIPEQPWNSSFGLNVIDRGNYNPSSPLVYAGAGGASGCTSGAGSSGAYTACTGGYAKPGWQTGAGVPADGARDLPDVSLFAAAGSNESAYPFCIETTDCIVSNNDTTVTETGGTSSSTPAMAGILALVNQKYGRQGQANTVLYALAAQHPSAFHDIAVGSNVMPCVPASPNCVLSTLNDNTNGFYTLGKYYATPGYDLATGLGSIDANLLLQFWSALTSTPTTTTLTIAPVSFVHGTSVAVSVAVSGSGGTPTGTVALLTTATPSTNAGAGALTLQNGQASSNITTFPGGQYQVSARYSGDSRFAPSTSAAVALNVSAEASTTSISGAYSVYNPYFSLGLYPSVNGTPITNGIAIPYGDSAILNAQPAGVNAPPGGTDGTATGTIVFTDSASAGTLNSGALPLASTGIANWLPTNLTAGNHSVVAAYSGDASFHASTSAALTFIISKAAPTTTISASPAIIPLGGTTTVSLMLGIPTTSAPPTGTVTFSYGATQVGSGQLISCAAPGATCTKTAAFSLAQGALAGLPLGTDLVTARYAGDANFLPVTATILIVVEPDANLTVIANPNPLSLLQFTTVTAALAPATGMPLPTGTLFIGVLVSGSQVLRCSAPVSAGPLACNISGTYLGLGNDTVYAAYSGDPNYAPSLVTLAVSVLDPFTVSGTPVSIAAGATTENTSNITVAALGGFTGTVALTCALTSAPTGAQHLPTCTIPASVNLAGSASAYATMAIASTAPTTALVTPPPPGATHRFVANATITLAGLFLLGIPLDRRKRRVLLPVQALVLLAAIAGCGGNIIVPLIPSTIPGTTAGAYTFTVTGASQGISANGIVTVTVH
jgi:hypothetical protein